MQRSERLHRFWASPRHKPALIFVLISLVCLVFFWDFHTAAFPEHAVNFAVGRDQATTIARSFLERTMDERMGGYTAVTTFSVDDTAKTYLEKELGVDRATQIGNETALWHFNTRFFRPGQSEEFQVSVAPDGRVVGFTHTGDHPAVATMLDREQAVMRAVALRDSVIRPAGTWVLSDLRATGPQTQHGWRVSFVRTDGANTPASREMLDLDLNGDHLQSWWQRLTIPDDWTSRYQQTQTAKVNVENLDLGLGFLPLVLAAIVAIVVQGWGRSLRRRPAILLALAGGALTTVWYVNMLPVLLAEHPAGYTTLQIAGWLVAYTLLAALLETLLILLFALAGPWLYRTWHPKLLALGPSFTWRGMTTKQGVRALSIGALAAPIFLAYQVVYYVVGRHVGVWSPADLQYSNLYSAYAPWLVPVSIGYLAGTFEEFAFRMFAIPLLFALLVRVLRSRRVATGVAIVLSAAIWALLHTTYPQEPVFARGIELTIGGVLLGWLFVRYGILASVSAHYSIDALLTASSLTRGQQPQLVAAAFALAALPLIVAGLAVLTARLRGGYTEEAPLLNEAQPIGTRQQAAPFRLAPLRRYAGFTSLRLGLGIAYALLSASALIWLSVSRPHSFTMDRGAAIARADAVLAFSGVNRSGYRRIASVERLVDPRVRDYLQPHLGPAGVRMVYGDLIPPVLWQVRYVRDNPSSELTVELLPNARPETPPFSVTLDTDPNATLSKLTQDEARAKALAYLLDQPGWKNSPVHVVETDPTSKSVSPPSSYHYVVFERQGAIWGAATLRAGVEVDGDRAQGFRPFVYLPGSHARAVPSATGKGVLAFASDDTMAQALTAASVFVLVILAIRPLVRLLSAGAFPWKFGLFVAVLFVALASVDRVNTLPTLFQDYYVDDEVSVSSYLTGELARDALHAVLQAALAGFASALALGMWRMQVAPTIVPKINRRAWARDTAIALCALPLTALGLWLVVVPLLGGLPESSMGPADWSPAGVETYVPALAVFGALRTTALVAIVALAVYLVLRGVLRRDRLVLCVTLLLLGSLPAVAPVRTDLLELGLVGAMVAVGFVVAVRAFLGANVVAYLGGGAAFLVLAYSIDDLTAGNPWLVLNGAALLAVGGVAGAFACKRIVSEEETTGDATLLEAGAMAIVMPSALESPSEATLASWPSRPDPMCRPIVAPRDGELEPLLR